MNVYFGQPWDAPFISDATEAPTPVGERCLECNEPVVDGDQGVIMPYSYVGENGKPAHRMAAEHRGCFLLGVMGHLAGTCFCHNDKGTIRERGLATVAWAERVHRAADG